MTALITIIVVLLVQVFLGMRISIAIASSGIITYIMFYGEIPFDVLSSSMFMGLNSFPLIALPLFVLAGELMNEGGMSKKLVEFAYQIIGRARGGLSYVATVSAMLFAGVSGSAVADTAAIASILTPEMAKKGYPKNFNVAVIAASGTIGPIIPPSVPMIVYAIIAGVSIGKLFVAGYIPGLMLGLGFMLVSYILCNKMKLARSEKYSLSDVAKSFIDAIWALLFPIIVMGVILAGICSATEAAAIAVLYSFVVGFFIYRKISIKTIPGIILKTAKVASNIFLIIAAANFLGWIMAYEGIPQEVSEALLALSSNPTVVLYIILLLLLIIGIFMETTAAQLILVPVLLPVLVELGIDPLFFGVFMVVALAVGFLTPPVGVVLYVVSSVANVDVETVFKHSFAYIAVMILVLIIMIHFQGLIMWLPEVVFAK